MTDQMTIETDLNHCYTIAFYNENLQDTSVIVCETHGVYVAELMRLRGLKYIKIMQYGPSRVKTHKSVG